MEKILNSKIENAIQYKNCVSNYNIGLLTEREKDVLRYVILGCTAKKIGKYLNISPRTVESYIDSLKLKLHCGSKGEIVITTLKSGLIHQLNIFDEFLNFNNKTINE